MVDPDHIEITVPREISPRPLSFRVSAGATYSISTVQTAGGASVCEASMTADHLVERLLLYCPGYKIIALGRLSPGWSPADGALSAFQSALADMKFHRSTSVQVHGRLTDSSGNPLPAVRLGFRYTLIDAMSFYHYIDGMVPELEVGFATTREDGSFDARIWAVWLDPFVTARSGSPPRTAPIGLLPPVPRLERKQPGSLSVVVLGGAPRGYHVVSPSRLSNPDGTPIELVLKREGETRLRPGTAARECPPPSIPSR